MLSDRMLINNNPAEMIIFMVIGLMKYWFRGGKSKNDA